MTGGGGELARAIAVALESRGYEVLSPGREELDVASSDSVAAYFEDTVASRQLDLLVNNAGIRRDASFARMTEGEWDSVLAVNLRGAFLCSQRALRIFCKRRAGHIINIGSYSALSGPVGQANYSAAKAGLLALTKSTAREGGRRGVRANCVLPGWLETAFSADAPQAAKDAALAEHALGRFNDPAQAAEFVAFLHQSMPAVSGQIFQLDSRVGRG